MRGTVRSNGIKHVVHLVNSLSKPKILASARTVLRSEAYSHAASKLATTKQCSRLKAFKPPSTARHYRKGVSSIAEDTIYALSTPAGTSAIAVIRVSGPACVEIYHALCPERALPKPRYVALRTLYDPTQPPSRDSILDPGALVLFFPAPDTVTGEDVMELHVHGGPATVKAVLAAIPRCSPDTGAGPPTATRYAEPGEFTRRAFLNARLSLPQIEALSATLGAQTEQQRRISVRGSQSALPALYESWRAQLLDARGEMEALIDFSEDQQFDESPKKLAGNVARMVADLVRQLRAHTENAVRGELLRNGIVVALLGAPNAGKSSLLNRIVGREAAIVSQEAGTTRDIIEVGVDISGWLVKFGDMAGLRRTAYLDITDGDGNASAASSEVGKVEQEGIKRAKERALQSDVVVIVLPIELENDRHNNAKLQLDPEVLQTALDCVRNGRSVIVAVNKIDKAKEMPIEAHHAWKNAIQAALPVSSEHIFFISCEDAIHTPGGGGGRPSASDPGGIRAFLRGLTHAFVRLTQPVVPATSLTPDGKTQSLATETFSDRSIWQDSLGASARQRMLLSQCTTHLEAFLAQIAAVEVEHGSEIRNSEAEEDEFDLVVAAESLRAAADCLAKITGRGESGDVEEVLGVVFERFCVGK